MIGLTSLTSVVLTFINHKPAFLVPFNSNGSALLAYALCGIGVAGFMWWLYLEMKSRLKRSQSKDRLK